MENKWLGIFAKGNDNCLSEQEIKDYLSINNSDKITRKVEVHILDCELCDEALDGYVWASGQRKQKIFRIRIAQWAATAAAIVGLLFFIPFKQKEVNRSNSSIAANTITYIELTRFGQTKGLKSDAFDGKVNELFVERKYKDLVDLLEAHLQVKTEDSDASLLLGVLLNEQNDFERAIKVLYPLTIKQQHFQASAIWLTIQCHLNLGNKEKAKEKLQYFISDSNSLYYKEAKQLLKNLD